MVKKHDIIYMRRQRDFEEFKMDIRDNIKDKGGILNELRLAHSLNSLPQQEDKENKRVESWSHIDKSETQWENKRFESSTLDHSSLQDPHHRGFNSVPMNYFIANTDMRKLDGNDSLTWIFQMEQFFDLYQVSILQKVIIASLHLEPNQFIW
jgi:hypothetical protein